jgi:hypothetical protein
MTGNQTGETFGLSASLCNADGHRLSANQQVLLVANQEEARKQCQERAARWRAHRSRFPTADYYRFFRE